MAKGGHPDTLPRRIMPHPTPSPIPPHAQSKKPHPLTNGSFVSLFVLFLNSFCLPQERSQMIRLAAPSRLPWGLPFGLTEPFHVDFRQDTGLGHGT